MGFQVLSVINYFYFALFRRKRLLRRTNSSPTLAHLRLLFIPALAEGFFFFCCFCCSCSDSALIHPGACGGSVYCRSRLRVGMRMGIMKNPAGITACGIFRGPIIFNLRSKRDSNPRYAFGAHTLSRRASSATRASLQFGIGFFIYSAKLMLFVRFHNSFLTFFINFAEISLQL